VTVAVLGGAAIIFPSLVWLFRLSLRGSFDPGAETKQVPSGAPAVQAPTDRPAIAGRLAVAALIVGVGLLVFADARALHAVGVAALIAFIVAGFLWLAPALLP
jgi:cytochrome bd ubiquinol oxidase subunit II